MPPRAAAKGKTGPAAVKKKSGAVTMKRKEADAPAAEAEAASPTVLSAVADAPPSSSSSPPPVMTEEEPGIESTVAAADAKSGEDAAEPAAPTDPACPAPKVPVAAEQPSPPFSPSPPPFIRSVDELRGLSFAVNAFFRRWNGLQGHLDSIKASMDTLSRELDRRFPAPPPGEHQGQKAVEDKKGEEEESKGRGEEEESKEGEDEKEKKVEEEKEKKVEEEQKPRLELETICEEMQGRSLRRYVVAHMSEVDRLREEVPAAIKLAPSPARLVLSCIGRFYLQGSRAYEDPNSPMVSCRRACILILEFFLLSGCCSSSCDAPDVSSTHPGEKDAGKNDNSASTSISEQAKVGALTWRSRIIAEGGFALATAVDALGLALFIASFGIPPEFGSDMLYDILRQSNLKKKADILQRSPILTEKLPDIIQDLVQRKSFVAAADLACAFGLEEKYPPLPLLSSFMNTADKVAVNERKEGQCSLRSLKAATENQLAAYKSVFKCVEDHKLDASVLANFKIEEKVAKLEKEILTFDKKLKDKNMKRKVEDVKPRNKLEAPAKRPWPTTAEAALGRDPSLIKATQDQGSTLSESQNLGFLPRNMFHGRFPGFLDGRGTGQPVGNIVGSTGFGGGPAVADGHGLSLGNGMGSIYGSGLSVGNGVESLADSRGELYGWYRGGGLSDSAVAHNFPGLPDPTGTSFLGSSEQQGLVGQPPTTGQNLSQLPTSSLGMGNRTIVSNMYQFADTVEREPYYDQSYYDRSGPSSALPTSAPGYRPSYLG